MLSSRRRHKNPVSHFDHSCLFQTSLFISFTFTPTLPRQYFSTSLLRTKESLICFESTNITHCTWRREKSNLKTQGRHRCETIRQALRGTQRLPETTLPSSLTVASIGHVQLLVSARKRVRNAHTSKSESAKLQVNKLPG